MLIGVKYTHVITVSRIKTTMTSIHENLSVIKHQATINIGLIGHVSHGKTTLVKSLTGIDTKRYSIEQKQNKTIKLGYANCKIYYCELCDKYASWDSEIREIQCDSCNDVMDLVRHVSFVDCPGHASFMNNMLSGSSIFDCCIMVVAANEHCPQPQTVKHAQALDLSKKSNALIVQNKVECVEPQVAKEHYRALRQFAASTTILRDAPIIPISAVHKLNLHKVCEHIHKHFPLPERDIHASPKFMLIRSFDINRPGATEITGGVLGCTLLTGSLRVGDEIEILPGNIRTRVMSMMTEQNPLMKAYPGGLIGIRTTIDSELCRRDGMTGCYGYVVDTATDPVCDMIGVSYVSMSTEPVRFSKKERVKMQIGATIVMAQVTVILDDYSVSFQCVKPTAICTNIDKMITISKRTHTGWTICAYGYIAAVHSEE